MNEHLQNILNIIQQAAHLSEEEKAALVKEAKATEKEITITAFKLERTEKVKHTTAVLLEETIEELEQKRKAVEAQNKELEIESSLERVRTVAMGMRKPADLLDICQTLFAELHTLDFSELRNAMINIFDNDSISFLNYDYSDNAGKTITTHYYNSHPVIEKQVKEIRSSHDAFSETVFSGKDLEEWRAFRKEKGEKDDPKMDNIPALFYYFYSVGTGAIGISTYSSITTEKRNVLKRFRNVFDLAYRRFIDIEQAEAQAREAQIEAALERVRSKTMAMHSSDDVGDTVATMFNEFVRLGIQTNRCGILIFSDEPDAEVWTAKSTAEGKANLIIGKLDLTVHALLYGIHKAWKKKETFYTYTMEGNDLENYYQALNDLEYYPVKFDLNALPVKEFHSDFYFPEGSVFAFTRDPIPEEQTKIIKRFASVFGQTYRRYLDLQKAEEQARESQIQLALERVRARTMAMQKSDELKYAATLLFQQAKKLGVPAYSCGYNIWEKGEREFTSWMSTQDGSDINGVPDIPLTEDANFIRYVESKQKGEQFFVLELRGKRMQEHYAYLKTIPAFKGYFDYAVSVGFDLPETQIHHVANFSQGNLLFITLHPCAEFHDIFKRFAAVFEQTYTRFLDLQKAEEQAREAKIETALEKVRSRTMGMQHSNELQETALILLQQVLALGVSQLGCGFNIWDDDRKGFTSWMCGGLGEGTLVPPFKVSTSEDIFLLIYEAAQRGESFFVKEQGGEELVTHYRYMFSMPVWKEIIGDFTPPSFQVMHCAFFTQGFLMFISTEPIPEAHEIFKRFAKVFEQTYTRFLDLQKAEAQAREAKVEAALERTRTQSMLMQHSTELDNTLQIFHEQVLLLGIGSAFSFLWLPDEEKDRHIFWAAWGEYKNETTVFNSKAINYPLDRNEPATAQCLVDWKSNEPVVSYHVPPAGVEGYFAAWQELIDGVEQLKPEYFRDGLYYVEAFMKYGCFGIIVQSELKEDEKKILARFAIEFERTYTRFLDLQKAEAQAREAQIEAALEKVRSRTMAMHSSEDVSLATTTMFTELEKLGVENFRGGILNIKENKTMDVWSVNKSTDTNPNDPVGRGKTIRAAGEWDMTMHPWWMQLYDGWESKNEFSYYFLSGKEKDDYVRILDARRDYIPGGLKELPDCHIQAYYFGEGVVWTFSLQPHPEEDKKVMKRFASVFSLTFRRYQDLKKAEAQAREASIEAALERVRSRSMGMQKSEELKEVIQVVYEQFVHLNIKIEHTGFVVDYKAKKDYDIWIADPLGVPSQIIVPYFDSVYYNRFNEAKERGEDFFATSLSFEEKNRFYEKLFDYVPGLTDEAKKFYFSCPGLAASTVLLENIGLYIENFSGIPYSDEDNAILMRFGKVFQQTYTRFLDLQKSETQVLEAVKRASVDRVRAEIASMRTTADLERITPLIWNELTTLGVPFIRCGVFIMDEERQLVETHLATPDGKAIATFTSGFSSTELMTDILPYWRRKEIYKAHWDEAAFLAQAKSLVEQGSITSGEKYLTENRPTDLYLHFLPFMQGMLYAGNIAPLTNDELQLVQNLADAFSTAYARYEDFNKLEVAKKQVDSTLTELQATQKQLVQSEKMASLGELTAGIAHEIQNPLNFVNNFSDVNTELIEELKHELREGNNDEVLMIANDIKSNEEKINHHGKRADAIVKGMLQHSRSTGNVKEPADINSLADEYLRLAYHGLRAKDKSFNATMKTEFDETIDRINIIPQDIGRVILNVITNAFYAVNEKAKSAYSAADPADRYEPTVSISTKKLGDAVEITVKDNGNGISQKVVDKIFQPFFTTKPTGQGTGLGLSLAYDIVKAHGGDVKVETKEGEGSEFIIQLPIV